MRRSTSVAIAERVARAVMPDLVGLPLYIVTPRPGTLITEAMLGPLLAGCYSRGLDTMLRADLEEEGDWRGPGPAVVVDVANAPARAGYADPCDAERFIVGTVLHELAHWLDQPEPVAMNPVQASRRYAKFAESCMNPPAPSPIPAVYWSHGAGFTRICCHIWYRIRTGGGYPLQPKWLSFGSDYPSLGSLAHPGEFIEALGDEMERLAGLPLRDLEALEPPAAFADLWRESEERTYAAAANPAASFVELALVEAGPGQASRSTSNAQASQTDNCEICE